MKRLSLALTRGSARPLFGIRDTPKSTWDPLFKNIACSGVRRDPQFFNPSDCRHELDSPNSPSDPILFNCLQVHGSQWTLECYALVQPLLKREIYHYINVNGQKNTHTHLLKEKSKSKPSSLNAH